jgi:hypothetical protein
MAFAIATRCRSPPDMAEGFFPSSGTMSSIFAARAIRFSTSLPIDG